MRAPCSDDTRSSRARRVHDTGVWQGAPHCLPVRGSADPRIRHLIIRLYPPSVSNLCAPVRLMCDACTAQAFGSCVRHAVMIPVRLIRDACTTQEFGRGRLTVSPSAAPGIHGPATASSVCILHMFHTFVHPFVSCVTRARHRSVAHVCAIQ